MNPYLTNCTSQVNDPAAHLSQPGINTWLSLPNNIEASRSRLRTSQHAIAAAPPYINAASQLIVSAALAFNSAPQAPLNYSNTVSPAQNIAAGKNSMSSSAKSNQHASSREQACAVRPAFSLADCHEGGHKLQNVNMPQTTSNDSHQFAPAIGNMQTLRPDDFNTNYIRVSGPNVVSTQESQICIGSVFSLVDSHIKNYTGQHETENEFGHITIHNSASPQTLQEHTALHVHHQNKTISAEKEHDTVLSQFHTTLSTKRNQYSTLCSAQNSPVHLKLPLGSIMNNIHQITASKTGVSLEVSSPKDDPQLLLDCGALVPTSAAHQRSVSVVTSIKDAQLPVSQKNGSIITETEKKTTHVLRGEEIYEKPASLTKPQDSSSTSQVLPNASEDQEPEIVDLDIEDIDDCMLVKIDLSRNHLSYGSKIHNSEVVIDDSDNDEDVTKETSVSSRETSNGNCDEQNSSATSTVVVGENDPCGTTGSFSMEVEEINTEASKTNSEQTTVTYTMSSTGQAFVMSSATNTQPLSDQIYLEDSCSTWSAPEIENPESELMDLHVGDDAALSTVEYVSLKASQPDKNVSTPVIQSVLSTSSLLRSTSDIPVLKESYCNPFLKPAVQGQVIENTLRRSEIPLFSSHEDVRKGQVSQVIDSSKVAPTVPRHESHHLQLDGATEITNSKRSHKPSLKGKVMKMKMKSTIPRPEGTSAKSHTLKIKIPSSARTQKKSPFYSDINSKTFESTLMSTETDSTIVCKRCSTVFSSQMELVTHTWNWHRSSQFNLKCDDCGKCFANNCLLKLHKKVKCTNSNTTDVDPATMVSLDSLWHTLIKQNRLSWAPASEVSSSSATFRGGVEPQPSTSGLSSGSAATDISSSTHVGVSSVVYSFPQRNEVVSNYSAGVVTGAATDKHPDFATGEELMQDIKPVMTSSGELLQRSDGPDQVLAGGHPSLSDNHKCTTCQKMFSNSFQLSLHQQVSEGCKVARNDCVRCFVCAKTFTSSIIRYLHVLNNPECKEKVDRYCNKCSHLFNSLADKQDHLRMFKACQIYEERIMKDTIAKNVGHVEQNVKEPGNQLHPVFTACEISQPDKSPVLVQENNSTQATDSSISNSVSFQVSLPDSDVLQQHSQINPSRKRHSEKTKAGEAMKQKPYVKQKPSAACLACKKKFATSRILIFHFNESPKCRMKICSPSVVGNNISAPEVAKRISASEVAKQISASEVAKQLRVVLSRVSVMCQVCHLPFADDIRLAEHLHLNQPCQKGTSETVKRVLEMKSHLEIDTLKRDGKRRSCEIVTGISNVTSTISMASTKDGGVALVEQMPAVDNVTNEKLAKGIDGHISSNSSAKKQYVCDQGNANDESKGHADDSDKDELISSMSPSDEGSDMEESGSSSEEGNRDYTCKQCCKTYTSKSLLIQHNKSHHKSAHSRRTRCKVCTRKFHDLTGLQAHLLQFKFCFIPLTRPLWERKKDPQICSMCKKVLGNPKDLRKHCFKKMACRLRYVNMVLKNTKEKDNADVLPAADADIPVLKTAKEKGNIKVVPATEAVHPVSKTGKENCEGQSANEVLPAAEAVQPVSKTGKANCEGQSANEVSSSVQDYCSPVEIDSSNSNVDIEDETSRIQISHIVSKPLIECLNCSGFFDDFQEHLLKQQSCLDFFGIHGNKCPVPLPFCYQCKTHFDDIDLLQLHACKGFVAYTHVCQICGLKFTSAHSLHAHIQQSLTCSKINLSSPQKNNPDSDYTFVESSAKNHHGGMFASSSAVRDVPTSLDKQFFTCLICDARIATLHLLMEHSHQHVEETPISCDRCSITFVHYNQFVSHQAFHIRMDKEANILVERPQLSTFGASTSTDKNVKAHVGSTNTDKDTRTQNSETMTHNGSACIFCHQEFGNVKAKLAHLNSNNACLAIMRYIIENKLFIRDQADTELFDRRVTDSNCCEFCSQSFSDKLYHYLNSACLGRLEPAIQNYRSSPHATQHKEMDSAVSQTECKETATHHVLMEHQGEQQLSSEASPSRDPTSSKSEFPEETCCLNCGQCFWTMTEVKEHLYIWDHRQLLPRSVMESADWQIPRCKICNLKYTQRHALFNHMVNKHSNKESVLFHELGYTSSCCSLCNQRVMSINMQRHFQQHQMKFMEEIKGKSRVPLQSYSVELCIFCNREYSSRKYLLKHMQRHTHADIFTSHPSIASPVLNSRKCSEGSSRKHEDDQRLGSTVESVASSNKVGSCKLCGKQVTQIRYHYSHFKNCHKEYDWHSWKQWFMPLVDLKQGSSPTKTVTSSKKPRATDSKSKDSDSAVFDSGVQNDSLPSVSKKTALLQPLGSCKLCHKKFSDFSFFKIHLIQSHSRFAPEDQKKFFKAVTPSHHGEVF